MISRCVWNLAPKLSVCTSFHWNHHSHTLIKLEFFQSSLAKEISTKFKVHSCCFHTQSPVCYYLWCLAIRVSTLASKVTWLSGTFYFYRNLKKHSANMKMVPPAEYHANASKCAILIFKIHFISILKTDDFHIPWLNGTADSSYSYDTQPALVISHPPKSIKKWMSIWQSWLQLSHKHVLVRKSHGPYSRHFLCFIAPHGLIGW